MPIIDGKKVSATIKEQIEAEVKELQSKTNKVPGLATVLVGEDPASSVYVRNKNKTCQKLGFQSFEHHLPENTGESELLALVQSLNENEDVNGILVQLPLPKQIDSEKILEAIDPAKDVDGFHPINIGRMMVGNAMLTPLYPHWHHRNARSLPGRN